VGIASSAAALCLWLAACHRGERPAAHAAAPEPYAPGLGEIMTFQQMRHVKLWLAGEAGNWQLAGYEVDELAEGFDDVVKYHPTHKDAPLAPRDLVPRMIEGPLAEVRAAVGKHDKAAFEQSYDALTAGCNNCHSAMAFGFNVVARPAANPYPDQLFAASR
jgi:hypothetical protein